MYEAPAAIGSVTEVPVRAGMADVVVCTEVLEHLEDPDASVREAERILKPGGVFMGSVPFLYPVHPDPVDFSRFTEQRVRHMCRRFSRVEVIPMGGFLGTVGLLIERGAPGMGWPRPFGGLAVRLGRCLCMLDDRGVGRTPEPPRLTTGYFWVARKA